MKDFEHSLMRDEFRGDFTRDTFRPEKTYSRVLLQQGRVQLDADWNEQVSITLHHLRNLACDVAGPHWGPTEGSGFAIGVLESRDLSITAGHYYVNGILCEADTGTTYLNQPNLPSPPPIPQLAAGQALLVYLDVWERHVTFVEDGAIREVALGGPDTASRAQIVWQVRLLPVAGTVIAGNNAVPPFKENYTAFLNAIADIVKPGTGRLAAQAKDRSATDTEPCLVRPQARYRGAENQLYRVEIHAPSDGQQPGTFKWSRENGSVLFPIVSRADSEGTSTLTLEHLGLDERFGLKADDWVEVLDDDDVLNGTRVSLLQVMTVDPENQKITLKGIPSSAAGQENSASAKHPYVRRWDQRNGGRDGIPIKLSEDGKPQWLDLEDGIQVRFNAPMDTKTPYRQGDYWLIPARQITGDIEWPDQNGEPGALLPHGVRHHYAPLAIIAAGRSVPTTNLPGAATPVDLRRILTRNWS